MFLYLVYPNNLANEKPMEFSHPLLRRPGKLTFPRFRRFTFTVKERSLFLLSYIRMLGIKEGMEEYEQRKQSIFNQLNFFQLVSGILVPVSGFFTSKLLPGSIYVVTCLPAFVSLLVLWLVKKQKNEAAFIAYFILYPFITSVVYMYGFNPGIGLFYILYGILSVFFLKDIGFMLFSVCFSLVSYFLLTVIIKHYVYELQTINYGLYLFNQALAILFIFYGLFLVKKENADYQLNILSKNTILEQKNIQIQEQANRIHEDSDLLKKQAGELSELNALKNKMFGIISHDLKAPLYALRTLFRNVQEKKMTATELKLSVPDIVNDLNYTVGLMDNLLQWAKTQMEADKVHPQEVDIQESIHEVLMLLSLQAKNKNIHITHHAQEGLLGLIDKNMNILVLRNLLSNAIKFTPEYGSIAIGAHEHYSFIEVYVQDSGTGISPEAMKKINSPDFYSTKGTASESGTGLGLMLCKEFLARNGSQLHIESEPGEGSTFSYSIPKSA
ncbi:MAG: HAMP domain-containing sensor histidine kinase [Chitinophagaceae bacterium]